MDQIGNQMKDPKNHMPKEKFDDIAKFGFILINEKYDEKVTTMSDLPAVQDDLKKARQTAKMFGICPDNTIELVNASNEELERQYKLIFNRILLLSRVLVKETGILGTNGMNGGFLWDKVKKSVLKLEESFDSIEVEFEAQDQ